jgi:hypothetical protein
MTTVPLRRTQMTVVERIFGPVAMSGPGADFLLEANENPPEKHALQEQSLRKAQR